MPCLSPYPFLYPKKSWEKLSWKHRKQFQPLNHGSKETSDHILCKKQQRYYLTHSLALWLCIPTWELNCLQTSCMLNLLLVNCLPAARCLLSFAVLNISMCIFLDLCICPHFSKKVVLLMTQSGIEEVLFFFFWKKEINFLAQVHLWEQKISGGPIFKFHWSWGTCPV